MNSLKHLGALVALAMWSCLASVAFAEQSSSVPFGKVDAPAGSDGATVSGPPGTAGVGVGIGAAADTVEGVGAGIDASQPWAYRQTRMIRVGKFGGGDFTSITAGLEAARALDPVPSRMAPAIVYVMPGVYEEQGLVLPDGVSLVGTNPGSCRIEFNSTTYDGQNSPTSALVSIPGTSELVRLSVFNTRKEYSSVAVSAGYDPALKTVTSGAVITIRGCILQANAHDVVALYGNNRISVENCTIEDFGANDTLSAWPREGATYCISNSAIRSPLTPLWLAGTGRVFFRNCEIAGEQGILVFSDNDKDGTVFAEFHQCSLLSPRLVALAAGKHKVRLSRNSYFGKTLGGYRDLVEVEFDEFGPLSLRDGLRTFGGGTKFERPILVPRPPDAGRQPATTPPTPPPSTPAPAARQ